MATPLVDGAGIVVRGEVKTIYQVVAMGKEVQSDGASLIQAKTQCDRTISILKQGPDDAPVYEVNVSMPGSKETERSYGGPEGSDACRVFKGYLSAMEKGNAS